MKNPRKLLSSLSIFLLSALMFASCKQDDTLVALPLTTNPESTRTEAAGSKDITAVAIADPQFSTLVSALKKANLLTTLQGSGPFTVFAPNNTAFTKAGINNLKSFTSAALKPILTSHVISGTVKVGDIKSGTAKTVNSNNNIYLSKNSDGVFINGNIKIIATDVTASNGVIHVIDNVIVPPVANMYDTILKDPNFSEFASLINKCYDVKLVGIGLYSNLLVDLLYNRSDDADTGFTLFAPTNAAFSELYKTYPKSTLISNYDLLAKILFYHLMYGRVFSTDLPNLGTAELETITYPYGPYKLSFDLAGGPKVKGTSSGFSNIIKANILAKNGVIHVIDKVLVPKFYNELGLISSK